ncbi:MAG: hypothetical protein Q8Q12_08940, partial [bacterium]|nr:hypothetical protein [bacterium]
EKGNWIWGDNSLQARQLEVKEGCDGKRARTPNRVLKAKQNVHLGRRGILPRAQAAETRFYGDTTDASLGSGNSKLPDRCNLETARQNSTIFH